MDVARNIIHEKPGLLITDLTNNIIDRKFSLHLIKLSSGNKQSFLMKNSLSSIITIEGEFEISNSANNIKQKLKLEEGLHLNEGTSFSISASTSEAQMLVASTNIFPLELCDNTLDTYNTEKLSTYHVDKPWGWEKWYTKNIEERGEYALKMIYMNEGNQSSLQSHKEKSETNYVIYGEANVIYGLEAPKDRTSVITLDKLKEKIYHPFEGWSNKVNELHRVIAKKTYKAIEVSTTELDDVIRWQDDALRPDGKITEEHKTN
jgi:mannose-6-phosphate isomerase-like protein (cupin superfamily)